METSSAPEISSGAAVGDALVADAYTLECEAGFIVAGIEDGEGVCIFVRVICTLVTMSIASAWFSRRDRINKLLLFFSHWLSGLIHQLAFLMESTMISVCWAGSNLEWLVKILKFVELSSSNMLAITNLAICVNLAFIVMSHRTVSRVKSVSSPRVLLGFFLFSIGATVTSAPFWGLIEVRGTEFWVGHEKERIVDWVATSYFFIEFFVGLSMLIVVIWLLARWSKEVIECWKLHARVRYYFGLTLIGTAVNLAIGITGIMHVSKENMSGEQHSEILLITTETFRYIHIALDTLVVFGVLEVRNLDERAASFGVTPGSGSGLDGAVEDTTRNRASRAELSMRNSEISPKNDELRPPNWSATDSSTC